MLNNHLKAQTLENFILRHGEQIGKIKWTEYIEKLKKRPKPKNPRSKKNWKPIDLIKHYDKKKTICLENITDDFIEKFENEWKKILKENPKMDSVQIYAKTIKALFTAKSQIKKEYWLQRFWDEHDAEEKTLTKRKTQIANESWYIKKYGGEKGKKLWKEKCEQSNILLNWTKKFGEKKANEMFDEYLKKLSYSRSLEGYKDKYGDEQGDKLWNEWIEKQGRNEVFFIEKYGDKVGKKKWEEIIEKRKFYSSLEGMIERYGEEEGTKRYNKWYESTKKGETYYVERYGPYDGLNIWNEINERRVASWKENSTLESFKERYGSDIGEKKWTEWRSSTSNNSKVSMKLFERIVEINDIFKDAKFGDNEEYIDTHNYDIKQDHIRPDFTWKNKIIEFYGSYWHKDPRFYENNIENEKIRKMDKLRVEVLEAEGFDVMVVWEADFEENPFKIYDECIDFLQK